MSNIFFGREWSLTEKPPDGFGFLYKITNLINFKCYIGITTRKIIERFTVHCKDYSGCPKLRNSIQKYGKENFKIEIIGVFLKDLLSLSEITAIKEYDSIYPFGYNLTLGGEAVTMTEETRKKISQATLGRKHSPETKLKMSASKAGRKNPNLSRKFSVETRKKMSDARMGKKLSAETRLRMSESRSGEKSCFFGKKLSPEHRKSISIAARKRCEREKLLNIPCNLLKNKSLKQKQIT